MVAIWPYSEDGARPQRFLFLLDEDDEAAVGHRDDVEELLEEEAVERLLVERQVERDAHVVEDLERQFPGLRERLVDEKGELRRFINLYVNEEDVRFLQGRTTGLKDGDTVSIVPAIAGGR